MDSDSPARRPGVKTVGGLEINQDLPFQRRTWIVERIGWAAMALLVLAALAGLFGGGPLSDGTAGDRGGALWLEYDRFGRLLSPARLRVHLGAAASDGGVARVWLDRGYLTRIKLERVTPEPDAVELGPGRVVFVFRMAGPGRPAAITFELQPERFGLLSGRVGLADGGVAAPAGGEERPAVRFRQLIYP